jgi:hypothetical protein
MNQTHYNNLKKIMQSKNWGLHTACNGMVEQVMHYIETNFVPVTERPKNEPKS